MKKISWMMFAAIALMLTTSAQAALEIPSVIGSDMVLQRETRAAIWGWDDPDTEVTIRFRGEETTAKAGDDGKFIAYIKTGHAGGPFILTVRGSETKTLSNVMVGEVDGQRLLDVHSDTHPRSRNHGRASGLSIGFTSHYRAMREQFGAHVTDGVAGENVLVDSDDRITRERLEHGALRVRDGHVVPFAEVAIAEPCVEFSRFVLGVAPGDGGPPMREPLQALRGGIRGFYVALAEPVDLAAGDELLLP